MPDVFLSYSRDDQATARRYAQGFERAGLSVWWDQTLNAGEDYDEVTEKALEEAKAVVVLWSKKSVASRWVRAEATQADRSGTLVPAMIEDCKRPIMFELKQTADLSRWSGDTNDRDWQAYLASVRRLVEKDGPIAGTPLAAPVASDRKRIRPLAIAIGLGVLLIAGAGLWMLSHMRSAPGVAQVDAPTSAATDAGAKAPVSIAVLPFANMSSDPEQEYFSDGLSEELLNQLAQVPDLRVIGRTSSFAFKGKSEDLRHIGEVLGVNHLLQGSVRKSGNQVKIAAQLINPADGSLLWSDTYVRTLEDIFAVQDEIARTVAQQLKLRMGTPGVNPGGTTNIAAYDEFLTGRSLYNAGSPDTVSHLERAVALDPSYVPAWMWLVETYTRLTPDGSIAPQFRRKFDLAIDRVVALAPGSPEASLALSYRVAMGGDLKELDRLMKDSLKLTGGLGIRARQRYGQFLSSIGQARLAVAELERVTRDDPLDWFAHLGLMSAYDVIGDSAGAEAESGLMKRIVGGEPSMLMLGAATSRAMGQGDKVHVRQALVAMASANKGAAVDAMSFDALAMLDDPVAARRRLRQLLDEPVVQSNFFGASAASEWAAYFGDRDLALQGLESLRRQGQSFERWAWAVWRPVMKDVRREPGFKKLVREMGLVDYWRATGNWGDFCKPVGKDDFECK